MRKFRRRSGSFIVRPIRHCPVLLDRLLARLIIGSCRYLLIGEGEGNFNERNVTSPSLSS